MASRYIQKYPIPEGFPAVLKEFTRQILRDQPQNVIQYAAKYFQCLEKGQPFSYKSQFNVSKTDKQYELNFDKRKAEELVKKDVRINKISGAIDKKQLQKISQVIDIIFLKYDKNRNGYLEAQEIKGMLTELYKDGHIDKIPSDTEVNSYITQMDKDKNGKVGKNQMIDFIRKTLS